MKSRAKIAAQVFSPSRAARKVADEPLTADDWRKIYEAQQNFITAVRRVVFDARCREIESREAKAGH